MFVGRLRGLEAGRKLRLGTRAEGRRSGRKTGFSPQVSKGIAHLPRTFVGDARRRTM